MLEREYRFFTSIKAELIKNHPGKFAVIVGEEILGIYDSVEIAAAEASKKHAFGTFLIQECAPDEQTTQHFHSRVAV